MLRNAYQRNPDSAFHFFEEECVDCGDLISQEEYHDNDGLCDECYLGDLFDDEGYVP